MCYCLSNVGNRQYNCVGLLIRLTKKFPVDTNGRDVDLDSIFFPGSLLGQTDITTSHAVLLKINLQTLVTTYGMHPSWASQALALFSAWMTRMLEVQNYSCFCDLFCLSATFYSTRDKVLHEQFPSFFSPSLAKAAGGILES